MRKNLIFLTFVITILLLLTGCTTSKSYTFSIGNEDKINVSLDTTDGYDLSSDLPFSILKDNKKLSEGVFIQESYFDDYVNIAKTDSKSKIIDEGKTKNIEYVFYSYADEEYNYIIKIKNANTGIILANQNSKEEAEKCFQLLTFSLKK